MRLGNWLKNLLTRNVSIDPWYFLFRPNNVATGEFLTEQDALKVSTVFGCMRILAQGVSTLPCVLYSNLSTGGKAKATTHPYFKIFRYRPNTYQDAVQFYEQVMFSLVMRGNALIQKQKLQNGMLGGLIPMMWQYVRIIGDSTNLKYEYRPPAAVGVAQAPAKIFNPDEVIHIRALAQNGIVGLSPIENAMEAVGMALATEKFGATFFANATTPSGVYTYPGKLGVEAYNRLKQDLERKKTGGDNAHKALILESGLDWKPMQGLTNEQAQFILTRKFTVEDICRWMGVQPHKVGFLEKASFANIEQQALEFVTDTLRPWLVRIEMALLTQIFPEKEYPDWTLEFLADALLRGDTKTRYEAHQIALTNGIKNIDEVRAQENMNPLPNGLGEDHIRPLNMAVIGEEPAEATPTTDTQETDVQTGDGAQEDTTSEAVAEPVVDEPNARSIDAIGPVFMAEIGRVERRYKKMAASSADFNERKFQQDSVDDLLPVLESTLKIYGGEWPATTPLQITEEIVSAVREQKQVVWIDFLTSAIEKQRIVYASKA